MNKDFGLTIEIANESERRTLKVIGFVENISPRLPQALDVFRQNVAVMLVL